MPTSIPKQIEEIEKFDAAIAEFGFQAALSYLMTECGYRADTEDSDDKISVADGWAACCDHLREAQDAAAHYNLQWKEKK